MKIFEKIFGKTFAIALVAAALAPMVAHADAVPVATRPAPALASGPWLNGPATTLAAQKGKVVVLLFWTRDCINCKHNLGYWNAWAKKYSGTDVAVLSVHTPETRFERAPAATARFAREHGLRFPILVDNDAHVWNAYGVQSWPTEVLIDKEGRVRAEFAGELNWEGSGGIQDGWATDRGAACGRNRGAARRLECVQRGRRAIEIAATRAQSPPSRTRI